MWNRVRSMWTFDVINYIFSRLTPTLMFCVLLRAKLVQFFGAGPVWFAEADSSSTCSDHWWTNLLYLNNFLKIGKYGREVRLIYVNLSELKITATRTIPSVSHVLLTLHVIFFFWFRRFILLLWNIIWIFHRAGSINRVASSSLCTKIKQISMKVERFLIDLF